MAKHVACGSSLLLGLPDDILVIIGRPLSPRDMCNLSVCCRSLSALAVFEKIWQTQCEALGVASSRDLVEWRKVVLSYKSLCRFLFSVKPLLGIWVHRNPEVGNVVYVVPGFASVVGCRIIPQKPGPLGLQDGRILWAPVFEVISDDNGTPTFILHGRDEGQNYLYPGTVKSVEKTCNVLLLEVERKKEKSRAGFVHSKGLEDYSDEEIGRKVLGSDSPKSNLQTFVDQNSVTVPFSKLAFEDRSKLLETVTSFVRMQVPDSTCAPLFPCLGDDEDRFWKDVTHLSERRATLIEMHKLGGGYIDCASNHEVQIPPSQIDVSEEKKMLNRSSDSLQSISGVDTRSHCASRKRLVDYVKNSIRHVLRRSSSKNGGDSSSGEFKHAALHDFSSPGDAIELTLRASTMRLSYYQAWPYMGDSETIALCKLPIHVPTGGQEYAGLWGGTFGWPPGTRTEGEPGKVFFFLVLSYCEESPGERLLIATKILECSGYAQHPNGSAMFTVNIDEPSTESFPWTSGADSHPIKQAFTGEGIADGYGFRYPGSEPGSLFVLSDGMLAFLWKETSSVLTLQRLNLEELLKKGERVPAISPIDNFSYSTRSYTNVFGGDG